MPAPVFTEHVFTSETDRFIASSCTIEVDEDAYFVSIVTDDHEGHALMTLPCATKVYDALGRALLAAREKTNA